MKRFLSVLLLVSLLLSMTVACQNNSDNGEGTTERESESETSKNIPDGALELIKDGTVNCTIVYNRYTSNGYALATKLRTALKDYLGANVYLRMDTEYDPDAAAMEILIGETNRPESQEALVAAPRVKDYFMRAVGNKVVLAGATEEMTEKAVNYFLSKYVYVFPKGTENASLIYDPADDYIFNSSYSIDSVKIADEELSKYSIVYPEGGTEAEAYVAYVLQNHLYEKAGLILPTHDDSEEADDFEILIGDTNRSDPTAETNKYGARVEGKRLQLISDGYFGYLDLANYVTNTLFAGKKNITLKEDFSYSASIASANIMKNQTGEYRVMFHNVWFHDNAEYGADNGRYEASVVLSYRPDVVGFNEFVDAWYKTDLDDLLKENGYAEVEYPGGTIRTPIFYNTKTVKLIAAERFAYGSLNTDSNGMAVQVNGKWYNDKDGRWSGATFAIFECLETGEQFGVLNTHLESNTYVPTQQPDEGDPIRAEQVTDVVIPKTYEMAQKYNVPIIMGGDFNSVSTRIACTLLVEAGFDNARDIADVKNDYCSCHGYPTFNEVLGSFVGNALPSTNSGYKNSIDQIFTYDATDVLKANTYRTIGDPIVGFISDHCPVVLDFSITGSQE